MKASVWTLLALLAASLLTSLTAQDIDSYPAVVVKTWPESGSKSVPAGQAEIKVTFSKEMANNSWSWSTVWKGSSPEIIGQPRYDESRKTCILKVKLEPGKSYGFWLNSDTIKNFKDAQGQPSIPYLLVFKTKP